MNSLIFSILLTLVPLIELRGGLPLAIIFAQKNNLPEIPIFLVIVTLNILLIFIIFLFLDKVHGFLINYESYKKFYDFYLNRMQSRIKKFEKRHNKIGFYALFLFVAIPLPLTGAYAGSFVSWILKLDRKKSIIAISSGIFVAGIIIYLGTKGIIFFLG